MATANFCLTVALVKGRSPRVPPLVLVMSSLRMNSESDRPRISSRRWVRTASVETQAMSNRGRFP